MELDLRDADVASKFDAGLQAHNAGDLNTAEKLYQQALSIQPDHCEANHNIGVVFAAKNELDKALKFFKYALDSSPNVSLFWASYIDALIKLERISESKTLIKAVRDAGISCEKIEAISQRLEIKHQEPGDKDSQELDELIRQEKFDEAIQKCLSLMETYPSSAALNINLGKCYFEQSEIERAISSYKKAIEYQPQWATSYILLGHLYSSREQSDQAIEYLKKAINLQPDNPELYAAIGAELLQKDKTQEAIQYLEKATKLNPKDETSHFNLGNALQNEGSLTPAIASYQKAITINPHNAEAYNNIGVALKTQGDGNAAIESYTKAIEINSNYSEAHYNIAQGLRDAGAEDQAKFHISEAIKLDPQNAIFQLAKLCLTLPVVWDSIKNKSPLGSFDQALRNFEAWSQEPIQQVFLQSKIGAVQPFFLAFHPNLSLIHI